MSEQRDLSIQINLAGISGRMQRVLRSVMTFVAIGLNAKQEITSNTLAIPDVTIHHQFDSSNSWSIEEAKDAWQIWILRNGFRDIAEALSGLLEEIQSVLASWELVLLQKSKSIRGEDWNEIIVHRSQQFHRRTLPQKLKYLEDQYLFTLDPALIRQAFTINAVRNCLTHRGGVVSQLDVDASGNLTLEWSALVLLARLNGQEQEVSLPYRADGGTEIGIATRPKTKSFEVGQSILVSAEEFTQLCWTLFQLAISSAHQLELYGKDHGLEIKTDTT